MEIMDVAALDQADSSGDEAVESELEEEILFKSFFDDTEFSKLPDMLEHCKRKFCFDLVKTRDDLELDDHGLIKLVNYLRTEASKNPGVPDLALEKFIQGDLYLRPAMADDAVLYNLYQLDNHEDESALQVTGKAKPGDGSERARIDESKLCQELNQRLANAQATIDRLLEERWEHNASDSEQSLQASKSIPTAPKKDEDSDYFASYDYSAIHETMLKDKVRTQAYRDFVYDNKDVFMDKNVLDIGCGTGILSMFCAMAGAKKVVAVDNSNIIDKTREIIFENGLGEIIQCLRGKIEEVKLPIPKFDIIISEWMGYCLLYEAMLDSVIWARDHYLADDGLMIPSHATIYLAPFADSDFVDDAPLFWQNVYGFKMSCMQRRAYEDVMIQTVSPQSVQAAEKFCILDLALHTVNIDELSFVRRDFSFVLKEGIEALDGFAIWFDINFTRTRQSVRWQEEDIWGFTTGPGTSSLTTHWQQTVLLIDPEKCRPRKLEEGETVLGHIGVKTAAVYRRALEIEVTWGVQENLEKRLSQIGGAQRWSLN